MKRAKATRGKQAAQGHASAARSGAKGAALGVGAAEEPRKREVLRAALALFAEKGYAGASLRELARRLGMQQPSLYHYFASKEQLLEQSIAYCGTEMLMAPVVGPAPERLEDVPRFLVDAVLRVYENQEYITFERFLFSIAHEHAAARAAVRTLYIDNLEVGAAALFATFVAGGQITRADASHLTRMLTCSIGLTLIERRMLLNEPAISDEVRRYADYVVELVKGALSERRAAAPTGKAKAKRG